MVSSQKVDKDLEYAASLLGGKSMIDCTHLLKPGSFSFISCYFPKNKLRQEVIVDTREPGKKASYGKELLSTALDVGTHIDSPAHWFKGARAIDSLSLSELILQGVLVDVSEQCRKNSTYCLKVEDLEAWEKRNGAFPKNSIVLMRSGWGKKMGNMKEYIGIGEGEDMTGPKYHPGFSKEAVEWLLKKESGVLAIGIDTPSLDVSNDQEYPVHNIWLGANKYQIENMYLEGLPEIGFKMIAMPLKVEGAFECTARVFAVIE